VDIKCETNVVRNMGGGEKGILCFASEYMAQTLYSGSCFFFFFFYFYFFKKVLTFLCEMLNEENKMSDSTLINLLSILL